MDKGTRQALGAFCFVFFLGAFLAMIGLEAYRQHQLAQCVPSSLFVDICRQAGYVPIVERLFLALFCGIGAIVLAITALAASTIVSANRHNV